MHAKSHKYRLEKGEDLDWLASKVGLSAEVMSQAQTCFGLNAPPKNYPKDEEKAVYGIHESLKMRLEKMGKLDQLKAGESQAYALPNGYLPQSLVNYLSLIRSKKISRFLDDSQKLLSSIESQSSMLFK